MCDQRLQVRSRSCTRSRSHTLSPRKVPGGTAYRGAAGGGGQNQPGQNELRKQTPRRDNTGIATIPKYLLSTLIVDYMVCCSRAEHCVSNALIDLHRANSTDSTSKMDNSPSTEMFAHVVQSITKHSCIYVARRRVTMTTI